VRTSITARSFGPYAIIVREYSPPREAGVRAGIVLMATLFGMAFGGWISGATFDWTGSYRAAFVSGIAWNLLNPTIAGCYTGSGGGGSPPQPETYGASPRQWPGHLL
jgi:MFS family permease